MRCSCPSPWGRIANPTQGLRLCPRGRVGRGDKGFDRRLCGALQLFIYIYFKGIHKFQFFTIVCFKGVHTCFFHRRYNGLVLFIL